MILDAQNLSYAYHDIPLFESLTLQIQKPGLYILKGANGSGKTTLLKILSGILKPITGNVKTTIDPLYIGHSNALHAELSLSEMIGYYAHFLNGKRSDRCEKAIKSFSLQTQLDTKIADLSFGQKRKVSLMRLFLTQSPLWILDEPFQGLDQEAASFLWGEIDAMIQQRQGICMMTTHDPDSEIRLPFQAFEMSKPSTFVMPAEAGIQMILHENQDSLLQMDSCLRRNDKEKNRNNKEKSRNDKENKHPVTSKSSSAGQE